MDARHINILEFIHSVPQFVIPIYQRKYSWEYTQCKQLWDDIIRAGKSESDISGHFIGSIVYVRDTDAHDSPFLVIDGQQRLTTLMLLITALSRALADKEVGGFTEKKLKFNYLINDLNTGDMRRKLVLSEIDRDTLFAVIDDKKLPDNHSLRINENFLFLKQRIEDCIDDLDIVCRGLSKLLVVYVALSRKDDNPQLIFESMNSTGLALSHADLIRNFILMRLETDPQTILYNQYWRPMEQKFDQGDPYHFDTFMRHYLTVKNGSIPRKADIYKDFKEYAQRPEIAKIGVEALVSDVSDFAGYYCAMAFDDIEKKKGLNAAFKDLRELTDVAYPFLLKLYKDYSIDLLTENDFLKAVRLIEAYVFRRVVCGLQTRSHNNVFARFGRSLDKDNYLESIEFNFTTMQETQRFPHEHEFKHHMQTRDFYNFSHRKYSLDRLENRGQKEDSLVGKYTIEHIMPQSEQLPSEWKSDLGEDWENVHKTYLHRLGNLTLTGYNSEYSNHPFKKKRDMQGGFRKSTIRLNEGLGELDIWNKAAIQSRGSKLADRALEVWPYPEYDIFGDLRSKISIKHTYSIKDHPSLISGPMHDLFAAFRKEVMALYPDASEEILKLYVAYKAETNFVDVVPQKKQLRISLNMPFTDINDPQGICRDVTNVGKWGNGDVEFYMKKHDEIPYAMELVRQSLEKQI